MTPPAPVRYAVLATDYDDTLATDGRVAAPTIAALEAARAAGRKVVLVTGRRLDDLATTFPRVDLFDAMVGENGAVLSLRAAGEHLLAEPPPRALTAALGRRGIPYVAGKVIVASWDPYGPSVRQIVAALGLPLEVIGNKGAAMVLPRGIDKRSGLLAALGAIGASAAETVAIGDAENDETMLRTVGCGVAVANALRSVKAAADVVTRRARGAGVEEIVARMLAGDLPAPAERIRA